MGFRLRLCDLRLSSIYTQFRLSEVVCEGARMYIYALNMAAYVSV